MNTVKYLIKKLEEIENKDLIVHMEGCDCYQDWGGEIEIQMGRDTGDYLLLRNG